jgi:tRNA threonylcarbamoyladenosine biosynthesis protein TsaB
MLICAIDTSGREGSVALAEGDGNSFRLLRFAPIAGGTYSAKLIPQIAFELDSAGRRKTDIGLLTVASGPGSFTGLRIGLGTVKAISEALNVPIVAISVLEAIAFASKKDGLLLTALDAQRDDVFVGEYEVQVTPPTGPQITVLHEAIVFGEDLTNWLSARVPVPVTYTPDASIEKRIRDRGSPVELVGRPGADVYALAGWQKYLAGQTVAADVLDANYLRRTDAEILNDLTPGGK